MARGREIVLIARLDAKRDQYGGGKGDRWKMRGEWRGRGEWRVRCESEESFHDEPCDDAFDFTDSTSRCVGGKTFHQKRRSKGKQYLHTHKHTSNPYLDFGCGGETGSGTANSI